MAASKPVSAMDLLAKRREAVAPAKLPDIPAGVLLPVPGMPSPNQFPGIQHGSTLGYVQAPVKEMRPYQEQPNQVLNQKQIRGIATNEAIFHGPPGANITFRDGTTGMFGSDGFYVSKNINQFNDLKGMVGVKEADEKMLGMV